MKPEQQLVNHITKEIEIVISNIMAFRMKAAFTVWIGPYLILGSIIIATKSDFFTLRVTHMGCLAFIAIVILYLVLGVIAGLIERGAWRRCNTLRKSLIEMCPIPKGVSIKEDLVDCKGENHVVPFYFIVFLIIGISFCAVLLMASGIELNK